MPPRSAARQGESKQGIIITLVIFILLSLGLGVSTYMGFAGQEELKKAKDDADKKAKLYNEEREWYKGQAWIYRSYMGKGEGINANDLRTWRSQFDSGGLAALKGQVEDKDQVVKLIKDLDSTIGWQQAENRPVKTYEQMLQQENARYDALNKQQTNLKDELEKSKKKSKDLDAQLQEAQRSYQTQLTALQKKATDDQAADRDTIAKLQKEVTNLGESHAKEIKAEDDVRRKTADEMKGKDQKIADLTKRVRKQEVLIDAQRAKAVSQKEDVFHPEWKIFRMDRGGTMPYINLGSADGVRPQATFSIHGMGDDGRPNPTPKGSLEVLSVLGDHLSQARITSVKDRFRDPIMPGDILHNPSWDPNVQKHVAIAGVMDLSGDGKDDTPELVRNLKRQNVIVDAYLDTRTGKVHGKITVDTDYLVVTDVSDVTTRDRNPALEGTLREAIRNMKDAANKNGVQIMSLRKYLEMIGYRLPRHMADKPASTLYNPNLRPEQSPPASTDRNPPERQTPDRQPPADQPPPLPPADK